MYCPNCSHPNPADAHECGECGQDIRYLRERVFIGQQFVFAQAEEARPVALQVDGEVQTFLAPVILSRHQHAVSWGDEPPQGKRQNRIAPLPDQPRLPLPSLQLITVITDRKIYKPGGEACVFIVAPDAARGSARLEIKLAGQKVYEVQGMLNADGLALHRYPDLREGEYTIQVALPDRPDRSADCAFSVAEFTLSPLIATIEKHEYAERHLKFALKLLLLSAPYSGAVEFGLQCQVCGERVVATQEVEAKDGAAKGDFDLSGHGGPFHVQVTTPDGNTALVSFPGTGAMEREHIKINPLGQTAEAGLLPWEDAQSVRGFYIGAGEMNMTPLMLESVHAARGRLQIASRTSQVQVAAFNPRSGAVTLNEAKNLERGDVIEFNVDAPYTFFTVGAFTHDKPFEGWGVVVKPVAFEAQLATPATARPGEEIGVEIALSSLDASRPPLRASCLLLVYDARLEHESPAPKLARRIYESIRDATRNLNTGHALDGNDPRWAPPDDLMFVRAMAGALPRGAMLTMAAPPAADFRASLASVAEAVPAGIVRAQMATREELATMVVAPTRMEFPELAYLEFFDVEGQASRAIKLGDQIGAWRVRAYVFKGVDYCELTSDVQADKPLYAELDLPAIASEGDDILASVNYSAREPAELVIATTWGETRRQVQGSGAERFSIKGPGRIEARIQSATDSDWTVRDVLWPGRQVVTASRLMILDKGQTARGEKVVVYASMGQALKDTITALIHYPFG
jgi:hypothetical protein